MENPSRDTVLSIAPNPNGEWDVLYVTNSGVQRAVFASQENANAFVKSAALPPTPERLVQRRHTIEEQTKRLEEDRRGRSKVTRLSLLALMSFSTLAAVAAAFAVIYLSHADEISQHTLLPIVAASVALTTVNASRLHMYRLRKKREQLRQRTRAADWATRAWSAASVDMQIKPPQRHGRRVEPKKAIDNPKAVK